jgi:hypothetical protein
MVQTRWLVLGCAVLLGSASVAKGQIESSRHFSKELQYEVLQTVVRISGDLGGGKTSQGSGVCIACEDGYSYILTAAHVVADVPDSRALQVETFTRASYPKPDRTVTVLKGKMTYAINKELDLALLRVKVVVPRSVKLCPETVSFRLGTPVLLVGCGIGAPPTCTVAALTGQDERKDLVLNRGAVGGRSGGLAYTRHGLSGILVRAGDDRTIAVNPWKIHAVLRHFCERTGRARLGR